MMTAPRPNLNRSGRAPVPPAQAPAQPGAAHANGMPGAFRLAFLRGCFLIAPVEVAVCAINLV